MNPRDVLARHASSFHMASRLLRPADANDVAVLYAVCRLIDDIADESTDGAGRIEDFIEALEADEPERIPVDGFGEMLRRRALATAPLVILARTAATEADEGCLIDTEQALLDYCYGVAGTVGELMCPLLGADPVRGRDAAVSLGIAMQLTNIARDVLEDARRGRRYLPGEWIGQLPPEAIATARPVHREPVRSAVRRVVDLAEAHYARAETGMALIPLLNRMAIRVAARLYRAIGLRVRDNGCRYWDGRVSLSHRERRRLALHTVARPRLDAGASDRPV